MSPTAMTVDASERDLDIPGGTLRWMATMWAYSTKYDLIAGVAILVISWPALALAVLMPATAATFVTLFALLTVTTSGVLLTYRLKFGEIPFEQIRDGLSQDSSLGPLGLSTVVRAVFLATCGLVSVFAFAMVPALGIVQYAGVLGGVLWGILFFSIETQLNRFGVSTAAVGLQIGLRLLNLVAPSEFRVIQNELTHSQVKKALRFGFRGRQATQG